MSCRHLGDSKALQRRVLILILDIERKNSDVRIQVCLMIGVKKLCLDVMDVLIASSEIRLGMSNRDQVRRWSVRYNEEEKRKLQGRSLTSLLYPSHPLAIGRWGATETHFDTHHDQDDHDPASLS